MILESVLRRFVSSGLVAIVIGFLVSCGGSSGTTTPPSGLKFRAFVSQDVSSGGAAGGVLVINALLDRVGATSAITAGPSPGLMAVSANKQTTMVFSASDNELDFVDNTKEAASGKVTLPGTTESLAITSDGTVGFAAVPDSPVAGMAPGSVQMINLLTFALDAPIPNCAGAITNCLSGARFIVLSSDNLHMLVFGDSPNAVVQVNLTNSGTSTTPNWTVQSANQLALAGLDHPVWAVFSQDNGTAYIMSCGAECGGTTARITALNLSDGSSASIVVPGGASYGVALGGTIFVAGTNGGTTCPSGTAARNCGTLSVITASGNTMQLQKNVTITDGYHNRMGVTSDGQVFVGARGCTNVSSASEQRGCLSIYNGNNGNVVIGTDLGDVTGIQPLSGRPNVYVVENGELRNWITTTDSLAPSTNQLDVLGQAVDVKLVD